MTSRQSRGSKGRVLAVDYSCKDTGKTVAASKKLVVWRFILPDAPHTQREVILYHSIVSGKKKVRCSPVAA